MNYVNFMYVPFLGVGLIATLGLISFTYLTRSHKFKLLKPRVNTNIFLNFFTNRVINKWNGLPCKVVEADSLNSFKNYIDTYFKDFIYAIDFNVD